ncbi:MAG TPA: tetratricopeptide repeat protein [Chloroflexia bacterium]|nr:tetratricopeptide repeat protein [Chloroflexia bacterium]
MAGNKAIYDTAMKRAHQYAWSNQWDRAIKEYSRALTEMPSDSTAQRNMAQCYFRLKQWPQALTAYEALLNSDPSDLFALNRLAEIYVALGQNEQAITTYNRLADLYVQGNQFHEAIRALRDLSRAMPKNMEVHARLLTLAQEVGDKQAQLAEHLAISRLALDEQDFTQAQQHVDAATSLDSENPEVKKWAYTVRRRIAEATGGTGALPADSKGGQGLASVFGTGLFGMKEQESPEAIDLMDRALEAQNQGDFATALELYDGAVRAGARRSSAFYNAGLLNQQMGRHSMAIPYLERAARDSEFATSANYVLGQCHTALGEYAKAVADFERALSTIDPHQLTNSEADELIELYTVTAEANLADNNAGRAGSLYTQLVTIFKERKWSHPRLAELERKADELYTTSIQSKLEGISRGSKMLDPGVVTSRGPVSDPLGQGSISWGRDPENDATSLIGSGHAGTSSMGTNSIGTSEMGTGSMVNSGMTGGMMDYQAAIPEQMAPPQLPDSTSIEATRLMLQEDGTSGLGNGTIIIEDAARPAPSAEMHTTVMRQPGSSLRTITEYLRATESGGVKAEGSGQEAEEVAILNPQLSSGPFKMAQHTQTSLSTSALMGQEQQTMAVQLLIAEGERAMSEEKWDAAVDTCLAVIQADPLYLPVHMMLGDIYLAQNKTSEAIVKYQTVMDTYMARKEPASAAEVCRRLLELQPDNPSLQAKLGMLLMEAGKVDEAAKALLAIAERYYRAGDTRRALEEGEMLKEQLPGSSDVALAVGTYQMALGNRQEALAELGRALHLDPSNDTALARLYLALASLNDPTQWDALHSLIERAAKDKGDTRLFMEELHTGLTQNAVPAVYYGLALVADRAGLPDVAADSLDQGLMQMSLAPTAQLGEDAALVEVLMSQFRGDLALNVKDGAVAAQHYRRTIDRLKTAGGWTTDDGRRTTDDGRRTTDDGRRTTDDEGQAADVEETTRNPKSEIRNPILESPRPQYSFMRLPEPGSLLYGLAEACALEDDWSGAVEALQELKGVMPNDHTVYTRLADINFRQGLLSQALGELNELLVNYQKVNDHEKTLETLGHMAKMSPNNTAVRRKLSDMYLKLGMTEYGLAELDTLAELQLKAGQLKEAMRTYQKSADLHYTLGQHDEAIEIYERIVRLAPRDIDTRQQLINMYIQSGKIKEAVASERSLSEIFIQDGQVDGAIAALHQLLALAPEDVPAHHSLAQQLMSLGEYGQAARLFGRLVRLEPNNQRNEIMQTEMQRMAKEVSRETEVERAPQKAVSGSRRKK